MAAIKMNKHIFYALLIYLATMHNALAATIDTNTAKLQAMDKITGRVSVIEIPVNSEKKFGSLSIVVRSCKTKPVEETPDNFAFMDITDTNLQGEEYNVFKGWMISSSAATHALEHPIYDVWLLQCIDTDIDNNVLLSQAQLDLRDALPMENSEPTENTFSADNAKNQLLFENSIKEMQSVKDEISSPQNLLMPNEFSFDEDEEIENISDAEIFEIGKDDL